MLSRAAQVGPTCSRLSRTCTLGPPLQRGGATFTIREGNTRGSGVRFTTSSSSSGPTPRINPSGGVGGVPSGSGSGGLIGPGTAVALAIGGGTALYFTNETFRVTIREKLGLEPPPADDESTLDTSPMVAEVEHVEAVSTLDSPSLEANVVGPNDGVDVDDDDDDVVVVDSSSTIGNDGPLDSSSTHDAPPLPLVVQNQSERGSAEFDENLSSSKHGDENIDGSPQSVGDGAQHAPLEESSDDGVQAGDGPNLVSPPPHSTDDGDDDELHLVADDVQPELFETLADVHQSSLQDGADDGDMMGDSATNASIGDVSQASDGDGSAMAMVDDPSTLDDETQEKSQPRHDEDVGGTLTEAFVQRLLSRDGNGDDVHDDASDADAQHSASMKELLERMESGDDWEKVALKVIFSMENRLASEKKRYKEDLEDVVKMHQTEIQGIADAFRSRLDEADIAYAQSMERMQKEVVAKKRSLKKRLKRKELELREEAERTIEAEKVSIRDGLTVHNCGVATEALSRLSDVFEKEHQGRVSDLSHMQEQVERFAQLAGPQQRSYLDLNRNAHKLALAVQELEGALGGNRVPLSMSVRQLEDISVNAKLLDAAISSIPSGVVEEGVSSLEQLRSRFKTVAKYCRRAALVPEEGGMWWHIAANVIDTFSFNVQGLVEGDGAAEVLSRAEYHLEKGELSLALGEMSNLRGEPQELARDWVEEATNRQLVEQLRLVCESQLMLITRVLLSAE